MKHLPPSPPALLGTLLLLLALPGCASASASAQASPDASPPSVAVATAQTGVLRPTLQIAGVIAPYRQVGIAADLSEPIQNVYVQEGDRVRAGQVLATLLTDDLEQQLASAQQVVAEDIARYAQTGYQTSAITVQDKAAVRSAQAALQQAKVDLAGAQTDLKRYENLASQGYLPLQTLDQQRTTVASDRQAVTAAQAALYEAQANDQANGSGSNAGEQQQELQAARAAAQSAQASVEQLKRQIARGTIASPVDGIVESVNANPGEYPSGRELFTIEQIGSVYAVLPSSSVQAVQIPQGAAATISVNGSTRKDPGVVTAVLDEVEPGTTNFTVKVLVPNHDSYLHAGMPVTGDVAEPPVRGVIVPLTAFVDDTRQSVYVIANGVARTHAVKFVKDDGTNAVVTGLDPGSVVVKDVEQASVGNGDRVAMSH